MIILVKDPAYESIEERISEVEETEHTPTSYVKPQTSSDATKYVTNVYF